MTLSATKLKENLTFQLTHPWGCDYTIAYHYQQLSISTHTPVRVWRPFNAIRTNRRTFQLTHPWGCDLKSFTISTAVLSWISTHTPVRMWLLYDKYGSIKSIISTHTPVRVWPLYRKLTDGTLNFNSHTREGVTLSLMLWICTKKFQLTHPWGCDN